MSATRPLRLYFNSYDTDSGLSRGTTDNSTQMNVTVVNLATNVAALQNLLTKAAQDGKSELVVQLSAFDGQAYRVQQIVQQVQNANGGSGWVTNFYPNAANAGVVEILMR